MLWNVVALKNTISNGLRVLRVAATSICSVAAGTAFCLPLACKNAPLGQRQGGVFRVPPPYLWTPPTPQRNNCDRRQRRKQGAVVGAAASKTRVPPKARCGCWVPQPVAKGCSPLTILKKKSKHKKASAAPVGASALTLFCFSIYNPSVATRQLPQGGASARPQRRAFAESGAATAVFLHDPTCENGVQKRPQAFLNPEIKNNISLAYAQSNAERIPNRPTQQGSCGLFYPFSGTKPTRSLTTSPPMIRPATEGTKALEPGTVRRAVHLR